MAAKRTSARRPATPSVGTSRRAVRVSRNSAGRWSVQREGTERAHSVVDSAAEAIRKALELARSSDLPLIIDQTRDLELPPSFSLIPARPRTRSPIEALSSRTIRGTDAAGAGQRTTLRVPKEVRESAEQLAAELATTTNDALIRLAAAGAAVAEQAREISRRADARWQALLAAGLVECDDYPSVGDMREAVLALRREEDLDS